MNNTFRSSPGAPDPSTAQDLATKSYVDTAVAGGGGGGGTPAAVGCRVRRTTNQTLTNATAAAIAFDTEDFDTDALHDTSSNTSRITIPTGKAGKYLLTANVLFDSASSSGYRLIYLQKNGATVLASVRSSAVSGSFSDLAIATIVALAVGDYVEVFAYQTSGGSLDLVNGNYYPAFEAALLGT